MLRVSIQGNLGSFSHLAAENYFGKEISLVEQDSFVSVFEDLKSKKVDTILIPLENTTYGSIHSNYDNLVEYRFCIVGEIYLKINFHLIGFEGKKVDDITDVFLHPVAIGQIQGFIKKYPKIRIHKFEDTAGAIRMIKEKGLQTSAGAAGRFAANIYGMNIIETNIHDNPKNFTRFVVLNNTGVGVPYEKGKKYKTTMFFTLTQQAGALYLVLQLFALRGIQLTKIESRPLIDTYWENRFFIDVQAHRDEVLMQDALLALESLVKELIILGSYEEGTYIDT